MSNAVINIGSGVTSLETAPQFEGYSKVVIEVDDTTIYTAGTNTGRTLVIYNPWGTQAMANKILQQVEGYQYQPYNADGALLDPAAELGDAVSLKKTYSGIFGLEIDLGDQCRATISAPYDEEVNHEYPFADPEVLSTDRKLGVIRASVSDVTNALGQLSDHFESELSLQSSSISAKVSRVGGDNQTFGWNLTESGFILAANGNEVMRITSQGAEIKGIIKATSGYIGSESQGFIIESRDIRNGMTSLSDVVNNGIYIGTDGIALGKGKFKVTAAGDITAQSLNLTGSTITDSSIVSPSISGGGSWNGANLTNSVLSGDFHGTASMNSFSTIDGTGVATYIRNLVAQTVTADYIFSNTSYLKDITINRIFANNRYWYISAGTAVTPEGNQITVLKLT